MGYQLREEPLTLKEIKAKSIDNFVEEVVPTPLETVIENSFEGLMDIWEVQLLGHHGILTDVQYDVVGTGMDDILHIKVSGYAELVDEE